MDPDLVRRLTAGEGRALLDALPPYDEDQAIGLSRRLRAEGFDPALVAAALTQSRLRGRAVEKFGHRAASMLFTADGLEQATRAVVARRHATHLASLGTRSVWDLGAGVGADAMAFADAGMRVTAVDSDPTTVAVCEANLAGHPSASTVLSRAELVELPPEQARAHTAVWFDPARRRPGVADATGRTRRIFRLDEVSPPWEWIRQLAPEFPAAGAKLSPALPHAQIPAGVAAQWTSLDGTALECALWWGDAAATPGRSAVVLRGTTEAELRADDSSDPPVVLEGPTRCRRWLYEPDPAVVQAGLVGTVCRLLDAAELDSGVGYLTSDRGLDLPWARRWEVLEVLGLQEKTLRAWARGRQIGRVTLKKRGLRIDAERLRSSLRLRGDREAVLALTRIAGSPYAVHVRPVETG